MHCRGGDVKETHQLLVLSFRAVQRGVSIAHSSSFTLIVSPPQVLDVNTNGVLHVAQAGGQQMLRFGNAGSIILIASMSGSITNRVRVIFFIEVDLLMIPYYRTMHGYRITPANQPFSRWLGAWLASLGPKISESTHSLQVTSIQSLWLSRNAIIVVDLFPVG